MFPKKTKVNSELKSICRYRSLLLSRTVLLLFLILFFYPCRPVPAYLAFVLIFFPVIVNHLYQSSHPERNSKIFSESVLTETMKTYHFSYSKYRSEVITSYLTGMLLCIWQLIQSRSDWNHFPLWFLPVALFVIYLITERGIYCYLHFKLHYNFTHLNI